MSINQLAQVIFERSCTFQEVDGTVGRSDVLVARVIGGGYIFKGILTYIVGSILGVIQHQLLGNRSGTSIVELGKWLNNDS